MLRKTCCFILLLFVFLLSANGYSYNYTNDGGKGKSISFTEPVVEKNGKIIKSSFSGIFRNNLEGVWIANSAIEVVASDKVNEIIEIQKKSQDSRHSDKTVIEAGSLIAELFSADTKIIISASESFTATIRIRDNKTKKIIVNWTTPVYINEEEFTSYAANDIALYALPLLGVNLSSLAKTNLSYRKNRPNESLFDAQSHFNNLTASIAEIDKQLSQIEKNKMEDNNAVAEKARLTAELEQLRIQQKEADVRVALLNKELKNDSEAVKWFKMALGRGVTEANFEIGAILYDTGKESEARPYLLKSYNAGNKALAMPIAISYHKENNMNEALKWYKIAAQNGDKSAKETVAQIEGGNSGNKNKITTILGKNSNTSLTDSTISSLKNNSSKETENIALNPDTTKKEHQVTETSNYNINLEHTKNPNNTTVLSNKADNKEVAKSPAVQSQQSKIDEKEQKRTEKAVADAIKRASKRKDTKSGNIDKTNTTISDKNIEDVINKKAAEYK